MEEANKLVGAGRKFLVLGKAVEAVSALQEACDMLAKKYGDTAEECGEAFFWCGKALLDLARMENSVLGNALEGVPEEDEEKPKDSNVESTEGVNEKTRDELRVQVYDAMAEKENKHSENVDEKQSEIAEEEKTETLQAADEQKPEKTDEEKHKDGEKTTETEEKERTAGTEEETLEEDEYANKEKAGDDEEKHKDGEKTTETEEKEPTAGTEEETLEEDEYANKEKAGDDEEEEEGADAEMEDNVEDQGEGDATGEKDSEDEEVGNLQLAWEMLEVAKVIYERSEAKEDQLMVAQTHLSLGEVSAESGNYTQALEDFQECLKLQLKHLEPDSRLLAETHYQLGVTYSLNCQHREAIEALDNSISVIKSRLEKLHGLLDKADGPEALPDERKELEELEALLPEIQEKVEDATEGLKTTSIAAEADKDTLVTSTTTAPVCDISHLVRKKRKPESPVKEANVKRVKHEGPEPLTTEAHKANGGSNGHAENVEVTS